MAEPLDPFVYPLWEVNVIIENLTEQELVFQQALPAGPAAAAPSEALPARFGRSGMVSWVWCGEPAERSHAVVYDLERAGSSSPRTPTRLVLAVIFPAAPSKTSPAEAGRFKRFVRKFKDSGGPAVAESPRFAAALLEAGGGSAQAVGQVLLRQLAAAQAPGAGAATAAGQPARASEGLEWLLARDDDGVQLIRLRLLPTGASAAPPDAVPSAAAADGDDASQGEERDDARLRRIQGQLLMADCLLAGAIEVDRRMSAVPLDPRQLRELPEKVRVDLVTAVLAVLLWRRQLAIDAGPPAAGGRMAAMKSRVFGGGRGEQAKERAEALANHIQHVYGNLVQLVGFSCERSTQKMAGLCDMYLSGCSKLDLAPAEPPDPERFCSELRQDLVPEQPEIAGWCAEEALQLCAVGEENRFAGRAWLLDPDVVTGVKDAVAGLNAGWILCPHDFCVVRDETGGSYFVLPRRGCGELAVEALAGEALAGTAAGGAIAGRTVLLPPETTVPPLWYVARQLLAVAMGAGGGIYDARTRAALLELCARLGIPPRLFVRWESEIGGVLFEAMEASQVIQKQQKDQRWSRSVKIAGGALVGGALLAVTGGLAAPALAAGLAAAGGSVAATATAVGLSLPGAVVGGALATGGFFLASLGTTGAAILFGGTGLGLVKWKLSTRLGALADFEFEDMSRKARQVTISVDVADDAAVQRLAACLQAGGGRLKEDVVVPSTGGGDVALLAGATCTGYEKVAASVNGKPCEVVRFWLRREIQQSTCAVHLAVFVSGWVRSAEDYGETWRASAETFFPSSGHIALKWEQEQLRRLTNVFQAMITNEAASQAATMWLKSSIVVGGMALWPVWIISYMANLDNAWLVVAERARQAGQCLAHVLADRHAVGQRPVTLIGHSMGARAIFYCLMELYSMGEFNVVDDVVLMGTPVSRKTAEWQRARAVVSGRLVNCFWRHDWVLAFCYRYLEWGITVAGLRAVDAPGVENVTLSGIGLVQHGDYMTRLQDILAMVGIGQRSPGASAAVALQQTWPSFAEGGASSGQGFV